MMVERNGAGYELEQVLIQYDIMIGHFLLCTVTDHNNDDRYFSFIDLSMGFRVVWPVSKG